MQEIIEQLIGLMGFKEFKVEANPETNFYSVLISDDDLGKDQLPGFIADLNRVARLAAKRLDLGPIVIDINNHRKEREGLIIELARAAAKKVVQSKESVTLPAMNAYERRLVHTELGTHPDVKTESIGEDKERCVIVRLVE